MALNLFEQTITEFATRFWLSVRNAQQHNKLKFHQLIYWLLEKITAGDITDNGARTTFNTVFERSLTVTQWTTLKTTRLQPIHDRYAAYLAEGDL